MTTKSKRDHVIELADRAYDAIDVDHVDRISLDAIDRAISDLRMVRQLMGKCPDADLAISYLEKMKRPRADKDSLGQSAKDAAYGVKIVAFDMVVDPQS